MSQSAAVPASMAEAIAAADADAELAEARSSAALSPQSFVWLVGSLCSVHGLAFDERLLLQRFAPPYDVAQLIAALKELGAHTRLADTLRADDPPLPAVALLHLTGPA